jgi:hypothetical protein
MHLLKQHINDNMSATYAVACDLLDEPSSSMIGNSVALKISGCASTDAASVERRSLMSRCVHYESLTAMVFTLASAFMYTKNGPISYIIII